MQNNLDKQNRITEGVIWKELIRFSLPLLIGNFFQNLYNTVDSIIVGRYVSLNALAAVNSSMPVLNMLIGFFLGLSVGSGVILAQRYGARDEHGTQRTIHTAVSTMFLSGIIIAILGFIASPLILRTIDTPDEVFEQAITYLRVFFLGSPALVLYNSCAGLLQSIGDSKRPLKYLIAACFTNIILDYVFVAKLSMGIAGAAFATDIAMLCSAALAIRALMTDDDIYRLSLKKLKIDKYYFKKIFRLGLPSGLQTTIVSFSNVIVQRFINIYDTAAIAGVGSYNKIDAFIFMPTMSLSLAATTFVGQNIGAGRKDRVKKIAVSDMLICSAITILLTLLFWAFWEDVLRLFSDDPDMLSYAYTALKWESPYYVLLVFTNVGAGVVRGSGDSLRPMLIMVGCFCVLRIAWLCLQSAFFPSLDAVLAGYPLTWLVSAVLMILFLRKGKWLERAEL